MTAYGQGGYYERRCAAELTSAGYFVWLARGSKGAADLLAIKPGELLLVQVKKGQAIFRDTWWNPLLELARRLEATALVADFPRRRGGARYRRIIAPHRARSRYWPCENWAPDQMEDSPP